MLHQFRSFSSLEKSFKSSCSLDFHSREEGCEAGLDNSRWLIQKCFLSTSLCRTERTMRERERFHWYLSHVWNVGASSHTSQRQNQSLLTTRLPLGYKERWCAKIIISMCRRVLIFKGILWNVIGSNMHKQRNSLKACNYTRICH